MKQINEILKKYKLKPNRYVKNGKATIVDTEIGRFVIKKNNYNILVKKCQVTFFIHTFSAKNILWNFSLFSKSWSNVPLSIIFPSSKKKILSTFFIVDSL